MARPSPGMEALPDVDRDRGAEGRSTERRGAGTRERQGAFPTPSPQRARTRRSYAPFSRRRASRSSRRSTRASRNTRRCGQPGRRRWTSMRRGRSGAVSPSPCVSQRREAAPIFGRPTRFSAGLPTVLRPASCPAPSWLTNQLDLVKRAIAEIESVRGRGSVARRPARVYVENQRTKRFARRMPHVKALIRCMGVRPAKSLDRRSTRPHRSPRETRRAPATRRLRTTASASPGSSDSDGPGSSACRRQKESRDDLGGSYLATGPGTLRVRSAAGSEIRAVGGSAR